MPAPRNIAVFFVLILAVCLGVFLWRTHQPRSLAPATAWSATPPLAVKPVATPTAVIAASPKAEPAATPAPPRPAEKLEGLRRPMDVLDTLVGSAAVKATIKPGETIVTGGYRLDDNTRAFSFTRAALVHRNGETFVQLESKQLALDENAVGAAGLKSLTTNAAHVLQNAEVWDGAEAQTVLSNLHAQGGARTLTTPSTLLRPGQRATVGTDTEQWEIVATPTPGQNSLDVEMRVETRAPESTVPHP